jgi:hypothetical protein
MRTCGSSHLKPLDASSTSPAKHGLPRRAKGSPSLKCRSCLSVPSDPRTRPTTVVGGWAGPQVSALDLASGPRTDRPSAAMKPPPSTSVFPALSGAVSTRACLRMSLDPCSRPAATRRCPATRPSRCSVVESRTGACTGSLGLAFPSATEPSPTPVTMGGHPTGIRKVNRVSSAVDATSRVPPCARAISEAMYRPSPRPC